MSDPSMTPRRAERFRLPKWSDPRLLVGLALVLASVAGTWLLVERVGDTRTVWAAATPLVPGAVVEAEHLVPVEVGLPAGGDAYLDVAEPLGSGAVVLAPVGVGELVPASALGDAGDLTGRVVALDVSGTVPASVATGSRVDVWTTDPRAETVDPVLTLEGVRVLAVDHEAGGFAGSGTARVEVFVPADTLGHLVGALAAGHHVSVAAVPGAGDLPGGSEGSAESTRPTAVPAVDGVEP
ncbi:hypothetical protein [Brevibacterium litoralis]|uniref:hypothetical protein n=1 Tax=Brevibacterium litoralis TaxID=3138935 RepID=UPI0032EE03CA